MYPQVEFPPPMFGAHRQPADHRDAITTGVVANDGGLPDPAQTFHEGRAGLDADPVFQVSPSLRSAVALSPLAEKRLVPCPAGLPVPLEVRVDLLMADELLVFTGPPFPDLHPLPVRNPDARTMVLSPAGQTVLLRPGRPWLRGFSRER
jgi:hypothetical protein